MRDWLASNRDIVRRLVNYFSGVTLLGFFVWFMLFKDIARADKISAISSIGAVISAMIAFYALNVAQNIGRLQTNAWVFLNEEFIKFDNEQVTLAFKNYGTTPAVDISVILKFEFFRIGQGDRNIAGKTCRRTSWGAIGPKVLHMKYCAPQQSVKFNTRFSAGKEWDIALLNVTWSYTTNGEISKKVEQDILLFDNNSHVEVLQQDFKTWNTHTNTITM